MSPQLLGAAGAKRGIVMPITASVGMIGGTRQCYNVTRDQEIVQDLLNRIPKSRGGAEGDLSDAIRWGIISPSLYQAILTFQRHPRSIRLSVDGHIDPRGAAITLMESLTGSPGPAGAAGSTGSLGTSEVFPGDPASGPSASGPSAGGLSTGRPKCGVVSEVTSGFLSGTATTTVSVKGGPNAQVEFTGVPGTEVELDVKAPAWVGKSTVKIPITRITKGLFWDTGMPPPVSWVVVLRITSGTGPVEFTFSTNWKPGDPICDP